jgi:hypothetical protein
MKKASALLLLLLTGCATQGTAMLPGAEEILAQFQRNPVAVSPVTAPTPLIERTKSTAVGNFLVASLVSSAAGSAGNATNSQAFQANTQISQEFGRQLNRVLPTGYEAGANRSADVALAQRLAERFQWAGTDAMPGSIQLTVRGKRWELAYESFLSSSDYVLSYEMEVLATEYGAEKPRVISHVSCAGSAAARMPLDKWQADDYQLLRQEADAISGQCFEKALKAYGLI